MVGESTKDEEVLKFFLQKYSSTPLPPAIIHWEHNFVFRRDSNLYGIEVPLCRGEPLLFFPLEVRQGVRSLEEKRATHTWAGGRKDSFHFLFIHIWKKTVRQFSVRMIPDMTNWLFSLLGMTSTPNPDPVK